VLWALDLFAVATLQRAVATHAGEAPTGREPIAFTLLVTYSAANLVLFGALAAWNGLAPWS
jgi:hypothetical protein